MSRALMVTQDRKDRDPPFFTAKLIAAEPVLMQAASRSCHPQLHVSRYVLQAGAIAAIFRWQDPDKMHFFKKGNKA